MKENFVESGFHWMVSGGRPVMPPGAKMVSMVRGFLPALVGADDWARASCTSKQQMAMLPISRFTEHLHA